MGAHVPRAGLRARRRGVPGRQRRGRRSDGLELRPVRRDHRQGRSAHPTGGRGRVRVLVDVTTLLRTPLLRSTTLGDAFGGTALLKAELLQKTGSVNARGVPAKLASLPPA